MNKDEKFVTRWSHERAQGIARYTIVTGVMAYGSTCGIIIIAFFYFISRGDKSALFPELLFFGLMWLPAGAAWGYFVFRMNDARFRALKKSSYKARDATE